jgi:glyoxylase I family protein
VPPHDSFLLESAGLARLSHVSLEVAEIDRALAFYRGVFGMQIVMDLSLEGPDFEAVTAQPGARSRMVRGLIAGNAIVQLFWHGWRKPLPEKRTLLSFEVRDARAAHAALFGADIQCRSDPVEFDNSIAFVIQDPDGHPIEIIEWKPDVSPYRAG